MLMVASQSMTPPLVRPSSSRPIPSSRKAGHSANSEWRQHACRCWGFRSSWLGRFLSDPLLMDFFWGWEAGHLVWQSISPVANHYGVAYCFWPGFQKERVQPPAIHGSRTLYCCRCCILQGCPNWCSSIHHGCLQSWILGSPFLIGGSRIIESSSGLLAASSPLSASSSSRESHLLRLINPL